MQTNAKVGIKKSVKILSCNRFKFALHKIKRNNKR